MGGACGHRLGLDRSSLEIQPRFSGHLSVSPWMFVEFVVKPKSEGCATHSLMHSKVLYNKLSYSVLNGLSIRRKRSQGGVEATGFCIASRCTLHFS